MNASDEDKSVPPQSMLAGEWERPQYTLSQIQYIPETIRRIIANCTDHKAEALLGKHIAASINIYRLVRETLSSKRNVLAVLNGCLA